MGDALHPQLKAALLHQQTVLTPNQRAARSVRLAFDLYQQNLYQQQDGHDAGAALWMPPAVLALDTWLASLWRNLLLEGHDTRVLLNRTQEHVLWRAVVTEDAETRGLRSTDSLAMLAADAWRLLHIHSGQGRLREFSAGTDARAFARWAQIFDRRCRKSRHLTAAELPSALAQAVGEGVLDLPNEGLLLLDFDTLAPAHAELLDSIERAGYAVERLQTRQVPADAALLMAADDAAEVYAAARWASDLLANDPTMRIAIVVPNLADRRAELDRIVAAIAAPDYQHIAMPIEPPYEFSLGHPLRKTELVATAFALLRWLAEPLPFATISRLLLSPFFGGSQGGSASETLAAARFDSEVLRGTPTLRPELSLAALTQLVLEAKPRADYLTLLKRLQAFQRMGTEKLISGMKNRTFAEWTDVFRAVLDAAGWTRAATANSLSFQTHRSWESALDETATLDFQSARVTAEEALAALERITGASIFAPASRDAAIQILGPLELGGLPFDALWLLGADDLTWPPQAPASPLLPFALQRALHMPGADSASDAGRAEALTQRVVGSASRVVVSCAQRGEEGERRLSPLIARLALDPLSMAGEVPASTSFEFVTLHDDVPLPSPPDEVHRGGSQILQLQAACGFRAFAEKRLWSTALDAREPGLDPRDRGNIVHRVMEFFWREVHDQQTLRALSLNERGRQLDSAIDEALALTTPLAGTAWDDAYLAVQRQRLRDLLRPWLDLELTRPEFAVRDSEKKVAGQIGPLRLHLRVDRIDDTAGGPLILDYKTGNAAPKDWLTDRPDQPQLPLYAVLPEFDGADTLGGVAFAILRPGKDLCLEGFTDSPDVLSKSAKMPTATLADQVVAWRDVLTQLATQFVAGNAAVQPKLYPGTCEYCAQRIVCRLDPAALDIFDTEEDSPREGDAHG